MRRIMSVAVLVSVVLCSGCVMKVPALMYKAQAVANPNKLPLTVGVEKCKFMGSRKLVDVGYVTIPIPFLIIHGGFPKTDQREFVADSVAQYFRDANVFNYSYAAPFDKKDVDLTVQVTFDKYRNSGNKVWPTILTLPYVNILGLILPQDFFKSEIKVTFDLYARDSTKVLSYSTNATDKDAVWIYSQPYGEYMWYKSVFRQTFLRVLDEFKEKVEADRNQIIAAAEKAGG